MNSFKVLPLRIFIFFVMLSLFTVKTKAQIGTNQLIINSKDSLFISVSINKRLISSSFTNKVIVGNLITESHDIAVVLDSNVTLNKSIFFNESESAIYLDLIINDSSSFLIFSGESKIENIENDSIYVYHDSLNASPKAIIDDSVKTELTFYNGQKGCKDPLKNIDQILANLDSNFSSLNKLIYLKSILINKCIYTKSLRRLLLLISYEDHRVELCKIVYPKIYDLDNFSSLIDLFKFEKSKNLFLKIIEENDQ